MAHLRAIYSPLNQGNDLIIEESAIVSAIQSLEWTLNIIDSGKFGCLIMVDNFNEALGLGVEKPSPSEGIL